ncbi:MAG: hypothetical protein AAF293_00700 [Pseudomonadota bacterium]
MLEPATDGLKVDPTIARIVEAAGKPGRPSFGSGPGDLAVAIAPGDARYSKFVDAVLALRLTRSDAADLSTTRISELRDAAEAVFNIRSGIPRDQRPAEVLSEQRAATAEQTSASKTAETPTPAKTRIEPASQPVDVPATDDQADVFVKAEPAATTPPVGTPQTKTGASATTPTIPSASSGTSQAGTTGTVGTAPGGNAPAPQSTPEASLGADLPDSNSATD